MNHRGDVIGENHCAICLNVMVNQNSVIDTHGHRFCKRCITDWLRINKTCPLNRQRLTISSLKPLDRDGEIRELKHCKYRAYGCDKKCYERGLKRHENNCLFLVEKCTKCPILLDFITKQNHICGLRKEIVEARQERNRAIDVHVEALVNDNNKLKQEMARILEAEITAKNAEEVAKNARDTRDCFITFIIFFLVMYYLNSLF